MARNRRTNADTRTRLAALGLVGMLVLAACGGSATEPPGGDTGEAPVVEPSLPADKTPEPGTDATVAPGDGSEAFAAATTALDALDSYAFRVEIQSTTVSNGTTSTTNSLYEGVVVNKPTEANALSTSELDADGNATSGTSFIVIGADAWLKDLNDTSWTAMPTGQAGSIIAMMTAFRPEQMFGTYFAGIAGNFANSGSENKNGVDTTHYKGDDAVGALLGTIVGVTGAWHSDVWIANDGGFLVHSEAGAESATGTEGGSFLIVVDITDPNSAGPIEPPS
ncbi:MAG: hypothetical protein HW391_581 [Chloroflexi bacterium]|nr:hypothetical protein [Chloroflexota bacterium]